MSQHILPTVLYFSDFVHLNSNTWAGQIKYTRNNNSAEEKKQNKKDREKKNFNGFSTSKGSKIFQWI